MFQSSSKHTCLSFQTNFRMHNTGELLVQFNLLKTRAAQVYISPFYITQRYERNDRGKLISGILSNVVEKN